MRRAWLCALWLAAAPALAAQARPLTLDDALVQADAAHPGLEAARARLAAAEAQAQLAGSLNDFRVAVEGTLRTGRNAAFNDRFHPDHQLRLNARKLIYDGGRLRAGLAAAEDERAARDLELVDARARQRLAAMARYFDVLLAEMQFGADTEFMAVAYVSWDNARDRQAVGQMAQWELTELETRYLDLRRRRDDTLRRLREKRQLLGGILNRAAPVREDLEDPALAGNERPLPELDALIDQTLARNPRLRAQRQLLAAAARRLEAVRADERPALEFEAEAAAWTREAATRDDLRAGVNFVWPLWQGARVDARLAREQARFHELQAEHAALVLDLRQAVLETREEIQYLKAGERRAAEANAGLRDLALEKARAEYELELKTNLGNSMAETQAARLRQRAVEYRLALAWARLDALTGASAPTAPGNGMQPLKETQ